MHMDRNASTTKKVINIIVIILVLILLIQNLSIVKVGFLLFTLKLPLIVIMAWLFVAGRYVSKAVGWEFDYEAMKKKYADMEDTLEKAVDKGVEEGKNVVDRVKTAAVDIKEGGEEVIDQVKDVASDTKDAVKEGVDDMKDKAQDIKRSAKTTARRTTRKTTRRSS